MKNQVSNIDILKRMFSEFWYGIKGFFSSGKNKQVRKKVTVIVKQNDSDRINEILDKVFKECENIQPDTKFSSVVNRLKVNFKNFNFQNQKVSSLASALISRRLGTEFSSGVNKIKYGYTNTLFNSLGDMVSTNQIDCSNFITIILNILNKTKKGGYNVNVYNPVVYEYDEKIKSAVGIDGNGNSSPYPYPLNFWTPGCTNLKYNLSLFKEISKDDDLTGAVIVTLHPKGYFDHSFISLNSDSSEIAESCGGAGLRTSKGEWIKEYYLNRGVCVKFI